MATLPVFFSPHPNISIPIFPLLLTCGCSASTEERLGHGRFALYLLHHDADLIKINLIGRLNSFTKMCSDYLSPNNVEFPPTHLLNISCVVRNVLGARELGNRQM